MTNDGEPAAYLVEKHFARFVEGRKVSEIELIWDQIFQPSIHHGRKGLVVNAISCVDLVLRDRFG